MTATAGALVVIATPIGNLGDLSQRAIDELGRADVVACEDTRHTRALLTHAGVHPNRLLAVHAHNEASSAPEIVALVGSGQRVALVTDAGTPGVSDPGQRVVAAVADAELPIEVVPGPSAVLAALVASGLPTDRFCFEGFLPRKGADRTARLAEIATQQATTVLYESPRRLATTLSDLSRVLGAGRRAVVARELTKLHEEVVRGNLGELARRWVGQPPRGECVVVVEGARDAEPATDEEIVAALEAELDSGDSRRSVVDAVAAKLGVPRRRVYELALRPPRS